ncbi:hypothetical protein ElyMa_001014600 [Elysia marginata]|uniref:Uncharacterized protein n=1 Tax=Elysia marginata TaxID=1093978 RepID=A0AAV4HK80_9GAST|nr:hypothetical protein ElyMa_001014600 [Elysia marginata]
MFRGLEYDFNPILWARPNPAVYSDAPRAEIHLAAMLTKRIVGTDLSESTTKVDEGSSPVQTSDKADRAVVLGC